ncbi:MAG: hypothetical protein H6Q00_3012 [Holophagaceae bacterium]|nr:hypothetical protein [Holophagaceae bacterium]
MHSPEADPKDPHLEEVVKRATDGAWRSSMGAAGSGPGPTGWP